MLKYISLSLILTSFSVSTCHGMNPEDRRKHLQARLKSKQNQKKEQREQTQERKILLTTDLKTVADHLEKMTDEEAIKFGMSIGREGLAELMAINQQQMQRSSELLSILKSDPGTTIQTKSQILSKTDLPDVKLHEEKISKIDALFQAIGKRTISRTQQKKIFPLFQKNQLDWSDMEIIQGNLLRCLHSVLKSITQVRDGIEREAEFYSGLNTKFSTDQAIALDFLPYAHKWRRAFVLTLEPLFNRKAFKNHTLDGEIEKAILRGGYGLVPATALSYLKEEPWDFKTVLEVYGMLSRYALLDLNQHNQTCQELEANKELDPLVRKKCALFYAPLFENAIESYIQFSELLLPYVKIINSVINIPGLEEVFSCKNIITEALEQEKKKHQEERKLPFSRDVILALQEKYKQREALEKAKKREALQEKKLELPMIDETGQRPVIETEISSSFVEESYSSSSIAQTGKKEYREKIAEADRRAERKQAAKAKKPKNIQPTKVLTKTPEVPVVQTPVLEIGGGPFKIYQKIMNQSFKSSIEKVILLIEALGGKVDEGRSGSRIKFELPHITRHNAKTYLDMLPLEYESEKEEGVLNTPETNVPVIHDGMHTPHKKRSNKLRSYHVEDVKALLMKAGYIEGTVQKQ